MARPSVAAQVHALSGMTVAQLRERWREVFGEETSQRHKQYMVRRLAWKLQEDQLPQLTPEQEARVAAHRRELEALPPEQWFPGAGRRKRAPTAPQERHRATLNHRAISPGTVLTRAYRGHQLAVKALDGGRFEYDNRVYRSLSAIAREITGTSWNGWVFFGLARRADR